MEESQGGLHALGMSCSKASKIHCTSARPRHCSLLAQLCVRARRALRAQAFELGAAKWEFENARKAFGDTMRMFAPGGGAGHFLANAIARRTDRVRAHGLPGNPRSGSPARYLAVAVSWHTTKARGRLSTSCVTAGVCAHMVHANESFLYDVKQ